MTRSRHDFVLQLFSKIAPTYDVTNTALSLGLHHRWNQALVRSLQAKPEHTYLDICAGTGAISERYIQTYQPTADVFLLDFCPAMLEQAHLRFSRQPMTQLPHFVLGDAMQLPFEASSIDCMSMAYGLRNIEDPSRAIQECFRVLRPGAFLGILELTRPRNKLLENLHRLWLNHIVIRVGGWLSKTPQAYAYLEQSIQSFIEPSQVKKLLQEAGFRHIQIKPLNMGIATILLAQK